MANPNETRVRYYVQVKVVHSAASAAQVPESTLVISYGKLDFSKPWECTALIACI